MDDLSLSAGFFLDVRCSWTLVPCIRSQESAGHMVVCVVMDQMVGDRQSPGATILEGRDHQPPPPTIAFQSRRQVPYIVMDLSSCAS